MRPTYPQSRLRVRRDRHGFSLVELLVASAVLGLVALGLCSAFVASHDLDRSNRDTREAELLARRAAERLRTLSPREMIRIAAANAAGESTMLDTLGDAAGSSLQDARVEIELPVDATTGLVREDVDDADLGLPMDLNLDGAIDDGDRTRDCLVLPIRVRVAWRGNDGPRSFALVQVLLTGTLREGADANF